MIERSEDKSKMNRHRVVWIINMIKVKDIITPVYNVTSLSYMYEIMVRAG